MKLGARLASSAVFIALGLFLLLVDISGLQFFLLQTLLWTMGLVFLIMGVVVWLYSGGDYRTTSRAGPKTESERRSATRTEVGRDIDNIRLSGYPEDRRYFGGHDPRINPPKKR